MSRNINFALGHNEAFCRQQECKLWPKNKQGASLGLRRSGQAIMNNYLLYDTSKEHPKWLLEKVGLFAICEQNEWIWFALCERPFFSSIKHQPTISRHVGQSSSKCKKSRIDAYIIHHPRALKNPALKKLFLMLLPTGLSRKAKPWLGPRGPFALLGKLSTISLIFLRHGIHVWICALWLLTI